MNLLQEISGCGLLDLKVFNLLTNANCDTERFIVTLLIVESWRFFKKEVLVAQPFPPTQPRHGVSTLPYLMVSRCCEWLRECSRSQTVKEGKSNSPKPTFFSFAHNAIKIDYNKPALPLEQDRIRNFDTWIRDQRLLYHL